MYGRLEFEARLWAIQHYLAWTETRSLGVIIPDVLRIFFYGLSPHQWANVSPMITLTYRNKHGEKQ